MARECGTCKVCYSLLSVKESDQFRCMWAQSDVGHDSMRPDKSYVVFYTSKAQVHAVVDPKHPKAHMKGEPEQFIRHVVSTGEKVTLKIGDKTYLVR